MDMRDFQSFYEENLGPVYRYVYGKTGNREEAEDLTAQIFIKAMRGLDLQRGTRSGQAWLFQVARTTIADYWRTYYRGGASSLDDLLASGWEGPTDEESPLVSDRATDRIHAILQALSERDREVLTCRFLLNLSVRETAVRMGLTEANTKVVQFRALKHAAQLEGITA